MTGAEKPRLIESTGRSVTVSKLICSSVSASRTICSGPIGFAVSAPNSLSFNGSTIGALSGWSGVGSMRCDSFSTARPPPGSWLNDAVTRGVPAWLYQRRNWVRATPPASSMQATKSSQVAAVPSKRSKYRSVAARKRCGPSIVAIIRITSAPLL